MQKIAVIIVALQMCTIIAFSQKAYFKYDNIITTIVTTVQRVQNRAASRGRDHYADDLTEASNPTN